STKSAKVINDPRASAFQVSLGNCMWVGGIMEIVNLSLEEVSVEIGQIVAFVLSGFAHYSRCYNHAKRIESDLGTIPVWVSDPIRLQNAVVITDRDVTAVVLRLDANHVANWIRRFDHQQVVVVITNKNFGQSRVGVELILIAMWQKKMVASKREFRSGGVL